MGLQFVIGNITAPKRKEMIDSIATILQNEPEAKLFYLVPDHAKFEMEMAVLKDLHQHPLYSDREIMGMIRLQVFSFSRLAWYLLQDSTLYSTPQLSDIGLSMLVQKILSENEDQLSIFRGESHNQGFVEKLVQLFREFRQGNISTEDLASSSIPTQNLAAKKDYLEKMQDIHLIYSLYLTQLSDHYIEKEDVLDALIQKVSEEDFSQTYIFVDGFDSFSAKEMELLNMFMKQAKNVTISLNTPYPYSKQEPEKIDLFYEVGLTYSRLYQLAKNEGTPIFFDKKIKTDALPYCSGLRNLEEYWMQSSSFDPITTEKGSVVDCVDIWQAEDKQAEVSHVANQIRQLTTQGYRYKEIRLLTRNIDEYKNIVVPVFQKNQIEVFVDQAETMSRHPLVEFLDALMQIMKRNWRYTDILRFLRTELFIPTVWETDFSLLSKEQRLISINKLISIYRDKVDLTENVVLAYGYEGNQWTNKNPWKYTRFELDDLDNQSDSEKGIEETANEIRFDLQSRLIPFFTKLKKAQTNEEAATLLYRFLEKNGINKQLLYWRDEAIAEGDLDGARKHEQVWDTFVQLLDEFVDILGEDTWDSDLFLKIVATGFENASYSIVPPSIDQVILTDFSSEQATPSKIVFFLGMTDQHLPMAYDNDSLLTEEDKNQLEGTFEEGQYFVSSPSKRMANEPYLAYKAFMHAKDRIVFSYPMKNSDNKTYKLSPYIQRIKDYFSIPVEAKNNEWLEEKDKKDFLSFIGTPKGTLNQLLRKMREGIEQNELPHPVWLQLYQYYLTHYEDDPYFASLLESLNWKNQPTSLKKQLAEQLYGKQLYLSVSQLETYYLDPFSHFLIYGLKLKERLIQELSPAETGSFFHEVLDLVFKETQQRNLLLPNLSTAQIEVITRDVFARLFEKEKYNILTSSHRMNFIRKQLFLTIKQVIGALVNQSNRSNMKASQSEVLFGKVGAQKGLPSLSFKLPEEKEIHLRGKIDRIDSLELNDQLYLSVVDYKSSKKKLGYPDVFYGLSMQIFTYLDTAIEHADELFGRSAEPAGAFYYHIHNPLLKLTEKDIQSDKTSLALLKDFKLSGFIIEDEELLKELDVSLNPTESSLVYEYKQLKDGRFRSNKFFAKEELALLLAYNRLLIKKAGQNILEGDVSLLPFKDTLKRQYTPSVGGAYKAVAQFDVLLPENTYRTIENYSKKQLLEKIQTEIEKEEAIHESHSDETGE
ncbi:PD-(D/E)XK nuclease family protein [Lacticigenium naphthae]|uniref:PD-(D/E)XK nuclease family protein n=1 Tax=Lacticigenium naphthae TaxID=515351 RepID=UPI0004162A5F|nr:PD-(D/E)XK nuclease family protein [Lacticigenium naphthae]